MIDGPQGHLFDVPDDVTYLNCAYMSPQLRSVTAAGLAAVAAAEHPWEISVDDFFVPAEELRSRFAAVVGAGDDADGVALVPAVSYGVGVAAANLPIGPGRTVVVLAEQFPSHVYPWRAAVAAGGGTVRVVERRDDRSWTDGVLDEIDAATAVVAVPNVHWTDGSVVDLEVVGAAARDAGAALVVDATQSLGAMPFDVTAVRPDFVVAAGYKWLMGPYSLGYLWASPDRRDGVPLEHGWITRDGAEDFAGLVDYTDRLQSGARRYDVGERSNFVLVPMAIAALDQILAWGVADVADALGALTARIVEEAARRGFEPTADRGPHLLGLRRARGIPADLPAALAAHRVYVSVRGDSIRVSPHLYNDAGDVERLFAVLDDIVG